MVHDLVRLPSVDIVPRSRFFLDEFLPSPSPLPDASVVQRPAVSAGWNRPPSGYFKLNSDASVDRSAGVMGLRVLIRDADGEVILSGAKSLPFATSVDLAEAATLQFGLSLGSDAAIRPLMVESDNQSVIHILNKGSHPLTEVGSITADILMVSDDCQVSSFSFVPRAANKGAPLLAKFGCSSPYFSVWVEGLSLLYCSCYEE
ncbi:hypothetical protein ACOSQ2_005231 [Xanthoceras sorbifolium]